MTSDTRIPTERFWLLSLLMVTFSIGTDDFVIAGALPSISADLAVSEGKAGLLVAVFSLAYAISTPFMAMVTAKVPPRRLLGWGLAVFAGLNFATAMMPDFELLMAARIVTALVAGTLSPAAFAIAGQRAAPEHVGKAIGTVAAGLTVSLAVGVPIGTWLSSNWGWRSTFCAVGLFTCLAIIAVLASLPKFAPVEDAGVRERLRALRSPQILACAGTTSIGACAGLMPYTYIAPISSALTSRGDLLTAFIASIGVAGALGAWLGGVLSDRWGADRAMIATFSTALVASALMLVVNFTIAPATPLLLVAILMVWGVAAWGNNAPMNTRTLRLSGPAGREAMALNTSGLYLGLSVGSFVGGRALDEFGVSGTLIATLTVGVVGVAAMILSVRAWPSEQN